MTLNNQTTVALPLPLTELPHNERYFTYKALEAARLEALHLSDFQLKRDRYVIFSDVHKGDGNPATDDFQHNVKVYCAALRYYHREGFHLVLNGDIEECWKTKSADVLAAYDDTAVAIEREFASEGESHYMRVYGNHDDDWADARRVNKYLRPALRRPVRVFPSVMLGERIMIVHGHQGDFCSDRISTFSRHFVRQVWRPIQGAFHIKDKRKTENYPMISARDHYLHDWARHHRLLLIAGHTHRAMFQPHPDEPNPTYHYINAGCCINSNGITGIEIDQGEIRLIKWEQQNEKIERSVFKSGDLAALLSKL